MDNSHKEEYNENNLAKKMIFNIDMNSNSNNNQIKRNKNTCKTPLRNQKKKLMI